MYCRVRPQQQKTHKNNNIYHKLAKQFANHENANKKSSALRGRRSVAIKQSTLRKLAIPFVRGGEAMAIANAKYSKLCNEILGSCLEIYL